MYIKRVKKQFLDIPMLILSGRGVQKLLSRNESGLFNISQLDFCKHGIATL